MSDLHLTIPVRWGRKQWLILRFRAPPKPNGKPQIEVVGILGEYGGGKTFVAMARFLLCCLANPFVPGVHSFGDEPMSSIVGPTLSDIKKGPLAQFRKICPEELILSERLYGEYQDIQLVNGHRILLQSAVGAINGSTLCQIAVDEIQEDCYDESKWKNYQGRVRDERSPWLNCQASGIADRGFVEDLFRDKPNPRGNRLVALLFPEDNQHLAEGYVDELKASTPASMARDADGWLLPQGAMFPTFSTTTNMSITTPVEVLCERPASIGVDLGKKAAVVASVPIGLPHENAEIIHHQLMLDNMDAEEIAAKIDESPINLVPGQSAICIDPTAEPDQLKWFRKQFPGVRIIQVNSGPYYREKTGQRAVDRAVRDAHQVPRLFVHPSLAGDPSRRGAVEMFRGWKADKPKDKKYEHAGDAVRYLIQHRIPLPKASKAQPIGGVEPSALHRAEEY